MLVELLRAALLLAWALVRTLLGNLFGRRRGLEDFQRSYAPDRLPPMSPEERALLPTFSGCIACGLCNVGEGARAAASGGVYAGVMDLMLASSRSMPDYDAAAAAFAFVGDERLARLEARCPTQVPMRAIARFVRSKAREVAELGSTGPARAP
jgi:succinate dehydrogenase/fumarate reductase-like Fe-S protein